MSNTVGGRDRRRAVLVALQLFTFAGTTMAAPLPGAPGAPGAPGMPGVDNPARAQVNYMLNCQGCHGPDGAGTKDGAVPTMKNFVGEFLNVEGGRAFLVRVPGSANSALSDQALAEVLNWMLWSISPDQVPPQFEPYTAIEVAPLRARPLQDVPAIRALLLAEMGQR